MTGRPRDLTAPVPGSNLTVAGHILALFGGGLEHTRTPDGVLHLHATFLRAGGIRVLVIDDNPDALALYERYTVGTRYEIAVCVEPDQVIELVLNQRPHLIILDIMMPVIDGWSLLARLRHHPITGTVPIIICTIVAEQSLALALGATDFVQKPVTRAAFLAALDRQLLAGDPEAG